MLPNADISLQRRSSVHVDDIKCDTSCLCGESEGTVFKRRRRGTLELAMDKLITGKAVSESRGQVT